jgi:hypothetical protein
MNYFLVALVLGMAGFAYYQHSQDEQQIAALQQQLDSKAAAASSSSAIPVVGPDASTPAPVAPVKTNVRPTFILSPAVKVVEPVAAHSSAIDEAATAATAAAASNSNNLGTITTLDGRTFENCKVLKVEADGVTFSHDDGITKVLFPLLPPTIQKQFDYDPQKAVAQTDAQERYNEQQAAATNSTSASSASSTPVAPSNP